MELAARPNSNETAESRQENGPASAFYAAADALQVIYPFPAPLTVVLVIKYPMQCFKRLQWRLDK